MQRIVYIGNQPSKGNPSTVLMMKSVLARHDFKVQYYGTHSYKIIRLFEMLWGILRNYKASLVLIDTYSTLNFYYAVVSASICRLLKLPYLLVLHGGNLPNRIQTNPILTKSLCKNAATLVSPSPYLAHHFSPYQQVHVIPQALELAQYRFKKRQQLQPKLLWVRAFAEFYNPNLAVQVLKELLTNYPTATLCMVGPVKDSSFEATKALAIQQGVLDRIQFTGQLPKDKWISLASDYDIFINTTTIDNTPVSVLEAMALGLAVVSSDVGGIPYMLTHNETAKLVPSNDVGAMVNAIQELIELPTQAQAQLAKAAAYVQQCDSKNVEKQWLKLLNDVV